MKLYRRGSNTLYDLKYHLVWCTKYRKPITDEMIMEYIKNQDEDADKRGDNFTTLDVSN